MRSFDARSSTIDRRWLRRGDRRYQMASANPEKARAIRLLAVKVARLTRGLVVGRVSKEMPKTAGVPESLNLTHPRCIPGSD